MINTWSQPCWPQHWGDDANEFKSERSTEQPDDVRRLRSFAFGAEPLYCLSHHLAMAEMKAVTSRTLLKCRVTLCSESPRNGEILTISSNLIHYIIRQPIKLAFTAITHL